MIDYEEDLEEAVRQVNRVCSKQNCEASDGHVLVAASNLLVANTFDGALGCLIGLLEERMSSNEPGPWIFNEPTIDAVRRHVALEARGKHFVGVCPFCSVKGLNVSIKDDFFHCFGCKASGDARCFLEKLEAKTKGPT